jgi:hypothetical protein
MRVWFFELEVTNRSISRRCEIQHFFENGRDIPPKSAQEASAHRMELISFTRSGVALDCVF